MHGLILLAALSSQITFHTSQYGDIYTITPQVLVTQDCVCQVQVITERNGTAGSSQSRQRNTVALTANKLTELTRLSMNISPQDNVKIVVTVSDGQSLNLAQQWPASSGALR
ncbi:curli assembly chaperone CsgC [Vagococcus sp. WN89Y]|uniref:curli assembly chaperone CsgC n=1 Tax=Vagococcus sp. WN89Y TaxID=3457258 RepID=UPI003FCC2ED5